MEAYSVYGELLAALVNFVIAPAFAGAISVLLWHLLVGYIAEALR